MSIHPIPPLQPVQRQRHGERLISALSFRLMNLPAAQIDAAITPALREIVETLGLDRSTLTEFSVDLGRMRFTHSWAVDGVEPVANWIPVTEFVPWSFERCKAGLPVVFDHIDDLPQEASVDKAFWRQIGLQSHITMPLLVAGKLIGGFSMGCIRHTRAWSLGELAGARQLADLFAIALARKQAHDDVERAMGFERLLADISAALIREPPRDAQAAVRQALGTIGEFLNVDHAALWKLDAQTERFRVMHSWVTAPAPTLLSAGEIEMPWLVERVRRGEVVGCSGLHELPVEAEVDKRSLDQLGARSFLVVPMLIEGSIFGAFSLATTRFARAWPEELVPRVRLLGETLATLLFRSRAAERVDQAQAEAAQHRERLAHLVRVHTVGEMSASIAHEINQPLVAIENYALAGRRRLSTTGELDKAKLDELLEKIGAQAARAGTVLQRLRTMLKKHEPDVKAADLSELVRDTMKLMDMGSKSPDLRVEIDIAPALPAAMADEIQIQQVLLNLVRNAIEAMEGAGSERKVLTVGVQQASSSELRVRVTDTGPGIAPGDAQHVFEAFYSTKASGLGIGLAISRAIVEAHGGRLWYSPNSAGGGVAFEFTLPAATALA